MFLARKDLNCWPVSSSESIDKIPNCVWLFLYHKKDLHESFSYDEMCDHKQSCMEINGTITKFNNSM